MPQLELLTSRLPWRIVFEYVEDPLDPQKQPHGICRVYDQHGKLLSSTVVNLPKDLAIDAFGDCVREAMQAYESQTAISATRTFHRAGQQWRRTERDLRRSGH